MKILIIGGTRFIGKEVLNECLKLGYTVVCLSRKKNSEKKNLRSIQADRNKGINLLSDEKFDIIIDFIGYDPASVELTRKKFINTHYYLISSSWATQYEEKIRYFNDLEKYYIKNKILSEKALLQNSLKKNISTVIRFPIILGERDHSGRFFYYQEKVINRSPILIIKKNKIINKTKFCFKNDVVKLLVKLIKTRKENNELIYEALPRFDISIRKFIMILSESLNIEPNVHCIEKNKIFKEFPEFIDIDPFSREEKYKSKYKNLFELFNFRETKYEEWISKTSKYFFKSHLFRRDIVDKYKWYEEKYVQKQYKFIHNVVK